MTFKRISLDEQLFTSNGWDDNGPLCPQFYNVELLVQVGEFPPGTKFPVAFFNGDAGTISFMDEKEEEHIFELKTSVGRKITLAEYEASRVERKPVDDDSEDE
jgi:hypothetical protein